MMQTLILSAALPAVLVAGGFFLTALLPEGLRIRAQALVLAAGFFVGYFFLMGFPPFPPAGGLASLPWAALALTLFVWFPPAGHGSRYVVRAFFVVALFVLLLAPIWPTIKTSPTGFRNIAAFLCLSLGLWSITEKASGAVGKLALITLPMIAMVGAGLLFVMKGSASLSQLAITMAMICGGLFVTALFFPKRVANTALLPFLSVFYACMLVVGLFYVDIDPWHLIYVCVPFLVLWIRKGIPMIPKAPVAEAIVLGMVGAAPLAYFLYSLKLAY